MAFLQTVSRMWRGRMIVSSSRVNFGSIRVFCTSMLTKAEKGKIMCPLTFRVQSGVQLSSPSFLCSTSH